LLLTNQLNGYGTSQVRYSDSHPSTPVNVPGSDRLVASNSNFLVKYPATGTYTLSVNWNQKTFSVSNQLTAEQRLATCAQDPRVVAGLVSAEVCAGADIFFRETFGGNGRTCGSCHPMDNNTTLDVKFITQLHQRNPKDPLFVNENDPNLANLETTDLVNFASILENVDGFQSPTQRFVSRTVSHVLSLKTSIARDPGDNTSSPPLERLGWGGDGVGDGSLLAFLEGAITQHFTKDLRRRPNVDFRTPTAREAELTRAFQLSLGRLNELNLQQVTLVDPDAEEGRHAFMDPQRGRCNVCHSNAGANFIDTGLNRNFDNGIRFASNTNFITRGSLDGVLLSDGGFGGQDLAQPNLDTDEDGVNEGFGNGTFSPPPLIEAADTGPFFHNAFHFLSRLPDDIDEAVNFYRLPGDPFGKSLGGKFLEQRFGTPLVLDGVDSANIARFLRVLNGAFNLDLAKQRLDAANSLASRFGDTRADIQKRLMELAVAELDDALEVLPDNGDVLPAARTSVQQAKDEIALGLTATTASARRTRITNALARVASGRTQFGSNLTFQLGEGNLMY
ncbi:MAG TPA: hypothetical protein VFQ61_27650, partial [Polyangiaceae bacterium]|nr:hypothetical protein [Polyangiaceae bacterium]